MFFSLMFKAKLPVAQRLCLKVVLASICLRSSSIMKVFDFVRQMVFPGFRERSQVERICSEEAKDEERPFPGHKGVQGMACHSPETYSSMVLLP